MLLGDRTEGRRRHRMARPVAGHKELGALRVAEPRRDERADRINILRCCLCASSTAPARSGGRASIEAGGLEATEHGWGCPASGLADCEFAPGVTALIADQD